MSRYSPTVEPYLARSLDFTPLTAALEEIQQRRYQRRQEMRQNRLDAERRESELYQRGREAEADDAQRIEQGWRPAPIPSPVGMTTHDWESGTEVPYQGNSSLEHLRRSAVSLGNTSTHAYLQEFHGQPWMYDPDAIAEQTARRTLLAQGILEKPRLEAQGRVSRTLLGGVPGIDGRLDPLSDEDLGRVPLTELDTITRAWSPPLRAATYHQTVDRTGRVYNVDPETNQAAPVMVGDQPLITRTPREPNDEAAGMLADQRRTAARRAFAETMVRSARARGWTVEKDPNLTFFFNGPAWSSGNLTQARKLGMSVDDYRAAAQEIEESRTPRPTAPRSGNASTAAGQIGAEIDQARTGAPRTMPPARTAAAPAGTSEAGLSDADLWEKKVNEGMTPDAATRYVRSRKRG